MDSGSRAATVGDGAANFTAAHLRLDLLNASSPPTRWDSSPPAEGTGLDEHQRFVRDQVYRDFTTTIQVFILISSLLGKSNKRIVHTWQKGPGFLNLGQGDLWGHPLCQTNSNIRGNVRQQTNHQCLKDFWWIGSSSVMVPEQMLTVIIDLELDCIHFRSSLSS